MTQVPSPKLVQVGIAVAATSTFFQEYIKIWGRKQNFLLFLFQTLLTRRLRKMYLTRLFLRRILYFTLLQTLQTKHPVREVRVCAVRVLYVQHVHVYVHEHVCMCV